jgi:hypothetical protein
MSSLFNQKAIPNYLYWMPFYSQHQTINNNYLYFEGNEKNNINNNIYDEKNKIENKKFILPNIQSPIPISEKKIFSESEKDDIKSKKTEKNITTKFFTDYGGYGYKCSCSKTQCNRYYCECYRSGLYCIDCNCKNCDNKPPKNYVSNRHPTLSTNQTKTETVICTCTKSGCNKKYCECYKNGTKCNSSCRCVGCENSENAHNWKKIGEKYECCPANSIYIVKNKIFEENIFDEFQIGDKYKGKKLEKKRKRSNDGDNNNIYNN